MSENPFTEEYFHSNNYKDYLFKRDRYLKMANELNEFFTKIKISLKGDTKILDYGCAVGFLLDGLSECGAKNLNGYDISEWALSQINKKHNIIDISKPNNFDVMFCLDVLEHMNDEKIIDVFSNIQSNILIVRIPCALEGQSDFHLEISKVDKTHINCKSKKQWIKFITQFGYDHFIKLNLNTIYDSDGVFCAAFLKKDLYNE